MADGYDEDFHGWAVAQADALRRRSLNEIDWENLIEEVESLGKSQIRELTTRLGELCLHLLKWRYQSGFRSRSWQSSIKNQRKEIDHHLAENPSLVRLQDDAFADAYATARLKACAETGLALKTFPEDANFSVTEARDHDFWPNGNEPGPPR